jgi:hypothetical protein
VSVRLLQDLHGKVSFIDEPIYLPHFPCYLSLGVGFPFLVEANGIVTDEESDVGHIITVEMVGFARTFRKAPVHKFSTQCFAITFETLRSGHVRISEKI